MGFPGGSVIKNSPANAGDIRDVGFIPGLGRSPGGGNGNQLQYSCLENPMDRGTWWATIYGAVSQFVPPQPSPAGSMCPFSMSVSMPALQIGSSVSFF